MHQGGEKQRNRPHHEQAANDHAHQPEGATQNINSTRFLRKQQGAEGHPQHPAAHKQRWQR